MTYFTDFPNRLHHPVEDVPSARLAAIDPGATDACSAQIAEHERLFHDCAAFYGLLEAVQMDDATLTRDPLVRTASGLANTLPVRLRANTRLG